MLTGFSAACLAPVTAAGSGPLVSANLGSERLPLSFLRTFSPRSVRWNAGSSARLRFSDLATNTHFTAMDYGRRRIRSPNLFTSYAFFLFRGVPRRNEEAGTFV
jgi:hypothetical protein